MPAWLLKVAAFAVTAMVLIGGTGYVSAHPYNALAPLRPPLATVVEPTDALDELLEIPIIAPAMPVRPPTPAPTPRLTVAPAPASAARTGSAATRPPAVAVAAPTAAPAVAPAPAATRAPIVAIAPSVRATSKPALTAPHSS